MTRIIKTYIDSGVLISAYQGNNEVSIKAVNLLDQENRQLISSDFVKLEVLSKAIYHRQQEEIQFYQGFFASCPVWADDLTLIVQLAQDIASQYGLGALDAIHVASAISVSADELITTEKLSKLIHRVREVQVISIAESLSKEKGKLN